MRISTPEKDFSLVLHPETILFEQTKSLPQHGICIKGQGEKAESE